jgi:hypothetical protein
MERPVPKSPEEMAAAMIANMKEKTGKTLPERGANGCRRLSEKMNQDERNQVVNVMRIGVLSVVGILALAIASGGAVVAQETPEKYMELLRSDVRTAKTGIMTEGLELSSDEADLFWPIYRTYDMELSALGDRRVALIKQYIDRWGSIDDEGAETFATEWFSLQNARLKLLKSYHKKISKATSPLVAARFVQIENVIGKLIDLQIAAELPLME